jgi:sulfur carrier protein
LIQVTINGATRQVPPHLNVAQLLEEMQLAGKRVAIERNGEIVPRSQYARVELMAGDQLEIVVAVGGG